MEEPTTITLTNRDMRVVLASLEILAKERGMPDHVTALRLGGTMRHLRVAKDESTEGYEILLANHAKRDETGNMVPGAEPGSTQLEDNAEFFKEQRALDRKEVEVEVWPISCRKLKTSKAKSVCPRCKQVLGMPTPEAFAVLVDVGILIDDYPRAKEDQDEDVGEEQEQE